MKIKTDGDLMRVAKRMQDLQTELFECIRAIENSEHPNAEKAAEALWNECSFFAWPIHVVLHGFQNPDAWDFDKDSDGTHLAPYHKAARKAARTRFMKPRNQRKGAA